MDDMKPRQPIESPGSKPGLSWEHYLIGFSSLIPILGILTSLISFIIGAVKIRQGGWKLILLALLGFGISGGLGYYGHFDKRIVLLQERKIDLEKVTGDQLARLARSIEAYKKEHGQYPNTLTDLPANVRRYIYDPETLHGRSGGAQLNVYDVMPDGNTYVLFSRGPDGEAFTPDDIFPNLTADEAGSFGYRQRLSDFSSLQSSPVPQPTASSEAVTPSEAMTQAQASQPAGSGLVAWRTLAAGQAESQKTGKPILYEFTATWCHFCKLMESKCFSDEQNAARINQLYIPIQVFDQRTKDKQNPPEITDLQRKYEIRGFPTLIVQFPNRSDFQKSVGFHGAPLIMAFLNQAAQ